MRALCANNPVDRLLLASADRKAPTPRFDGDIGIAVPRYDG